MPSPPPLSVRLLGGFAVSVAGRDVPAIAWQQRRAAAVVKLLALQPHFRLHREVLMETLWPDLAGEQAANNLRVAMHRARQRLEDAGAPAGRFLTRQQDDVMLGDPAAIVVDVQGFGEAAQRAWLADEPGLSQRALSLYAGDLLPEDPYEEWAAHRRTDLRISYLALLSRLAQLCEARNDTAGAIAATQRLIATEPLDEAAHTNMMRLYARAGAYRQALAQYDALAALLAQELDATPDDATQVLRDEILASAQAHADQPPVVTALSAMRPISAMTPELPPDLDLVGRQRELAELTRLLERHRLVTLGGPAGVGKTRLAEALGRLEGAHGRPVAVVELAAVMTPDLLLSALANALGATEPETDPSWEELFAHIGQSNVLLVLDNFEQILDGAPALADLLRACPRLALVVTSRERLRLRAEYVYQVSPLTLPESTTQTGEVLANYPAVDLFLRRAAEADPAFASAETDMDAIAEICLRLDGLPLAIELAAARIRVLPPVALLAHMAQPLPLLTGGPRDAPARQRTMRAAIAWSVDFLSDGARTLFQQLAIFPGSFSLRAAQEIAGQATREPASSLETPFLDVLEDLLDKHLLRRVDADPVDPRFSMLTVVREYATELLVASSEMQTIQARHAAYFQEFVDERIPLLTTEQAGSVLSVLEQDHPNLRAAMSAFLRQGNGDLAVGLATALWRFWLLRGHVSEGRSWIAQGLEATGTQETSLQGAALDADGVMAFAQGDFTSAQRRHEAALGIARRIGDMALAARALVNLGAVADEQGLPDRAAAYLEDALDVSRNLGDQRAIAVSLANLGQVAITLADYPRASALLNESVLAFRALGDPRSEAAILANLGLMSLMTGDAAVARHCHQEALRVFRALGDAPGEAAELLNLGHATQLLGDLPQAEALYQQAHGQFLELGDRSGLAFAEMHLGKLALLRADHERAIHHLEHALESAHEIGDWVATAETLEGLVMLSSQTGDPIRAAQTLGAAEALRETLGLPLPAIHQAALTSSLRALESALPGSEFADARAAGAARLRLYFASIQAGKPVTSSLFSLAAGTGPGTS